MSILHPWSIYAGVAAIGLPLAIHFLTRPRPQAMALSTFRFVRMAIQQRRARHRLRDVLVLLLRTAAIVFAALALARPWWGDRSAAADSSVGTSVRVVLLDVSESMKQIDGSAQVFQRAKAIAGDYLAFRPDTQVGLIFAGGRPETPLNQPSTNFELLRDEVTKTSAQPVRCNVQRALERAAAMLAPTSASDHRQRELVLISDFQRGNWSAADFAPLPADAKIIFESVAPSSTPANLAVLRTGVRGRATPGRNVRMETTVVNFSPADRNIQVSIRVAQAQYQLSGLCPAGRSTVLASDVQFNEIGWHAGEARLVDVDDALADDNVRPFVVHVQPKPVYALITNQPATKRPSSSYYLECALKPEGEQGKSSSVNLVRLDPEKLDLETLGMADLLVLDHPGKLTDDAIRLLAGLMRHGRPLVYVASEAIDATNLVHLQTAMGRGLEMPVEFQPAVAGQARHDLFLTSMSRNEAPFQAFGDTLSTVAGRLRFAGGLASRRLEQGLRSDVLATLNDGSALLVHTTSDAGQLLVLNADLEQSNLHSQYAMVLLIDGIVGRMLIDEQDQAILRCGESAQIQLPADCGAALDLKIEPLDWSTAKGGSSFDKSARDTGGMPNMPAMSSGDETLGTLDSEGIGVVWSWPSPAQIGVYGIRRDGKIVFASAIQPPGEEESNLETLPPNVLTQRLASGRTAAYRGAAADAKTDSDDSWVALLVACAVCLIGEFGVLSIFRS